MSAPQIPKARKSNPLMVLAAVLTGLLWLLSRILGFVGLTRIDAIRKALVKAAYRCATIGNPDPRVSLVFDAYQQYQKAEPSAPLSKTRNERRIERKKNRKANRHN